MAHLSVAGSSSVNGVAALHTKLLKENLLKEFAELYPLKFNNKTNGITPRRWLLGCNPALSDLITSAIGDDWITDLDHLRDLDSYSEDTAFREKFMAVKRCNKELLANYLSTELGLKVNPAAIFDSQIKRLHQIHLLGKNTG